VAVKRRLAEYSLSEVGAAECPRFVRRTFDGRFGGKVFLSEMAGRGMREF
jgi:hypothetical protein